MTGSVSACDKPVGVAVNIPATQSNVGFNYARLNPEVAAEAREAADRIRTRTRNTALDTGNDLIVIKGRMQHGNFGAWINAEFDMSERMAQRYMGAARFAADKCDILSVLPDVSIFALAAPSAPAAAVKELLAAAEAGTPIPPAYIKAKLDDATQAERTAKKAAKKTLEQVKMEQKTRESKVKREARKEVELRDATEQRKREEQKRTDQLRPLSERIVASLGDDLDELLNVLDRWKDRTLLRQLLAEGKAKIGEPSNDL